MVRVPSKSVELAILATLLATGSMLISSCAGPAVRIDNPELHRCYLDGRRETREMIPYRFYGTSRIDVLPDDRGKEPAYEQLENSIPFTLTPPASPWLFPFDFLVEVYDRTFHGPGDVTVRVDVRTMPPEQQPDPESRPPGIVELSQRTHAARVQR